MKFCKTCGAQLHDNDAFCVVCGTTVEQANAADAPTDFYDTEATTVLNESEFDDKAEETTVLSDNSPYQNNNPYQSGNYYQGDNNVYTPPVQPQQPPVQGYYNQPQGNAYQDTKLTFEQFYEKVASKKTKSDAKALAIITIITAAVGIASIVMGNYFGIIDVVFYGVFSFLLFKKKNWILPLIVTCYSGCFTVINLVVSGVASGIFALIIGIITTIKLKKVNDAYKAYQTTGQYPNEQI